MTRLTLNFFYRRLEPTQIDLVGELLRRDREELLTYSFALAKGHGKRHLDPS